MGEWLSLQPTETLGVDLFNFGTAWQSVQEACGRRGHQVSFLQADIADLYSRIPEGWADAIVSDADHCQDNEPVQNGGRYVPLDLFSKLASAEYLKLYADNSLTPEHLVVEVSAEGLAFRATYPSKWQELCEKYPDYSEEEFLIKAHWVWLRRGPILEGIPGL
jgi:hypothetical protein